MGAKKKLIDYKVFNELIDKGYNCKQLAKHFNLARQNFGKKVKKEIGVYPSVYIHNKRKENATADDNART